MGNTAFSCVRPVATPQLCASSPDHLSSVFKASLKTRRARSSYILSAPSSTRLMNRASSLSTDQSISQPINQYAARTPANKAAMPSARSAVPRKHAMDQSAQSPVEDVLEMNGLIVRQRPSLDANLSINTSTNTANDDDESLYTSTRCTIVPNTCVQFTALSPPTSENVSPRTVLAFLMTSNHAKDQELDMTNPEHLDKILREHQITQSIDHSTSQERDSELDTDDECDYEEGAYQSYITPAIKRSINEYQRTAQQHAVPTHHYVLRQPHDQQRYANRRNSY